MSKNEALKNELKEAPKKVKVSQSSKEVSFKVSKNDGKLKKDAIYVVSENVAEILEAKGLGKQVK